MRSQEWFALAAHIMAATPSTCQFLNEKKQCIEFFIEISEFSLLYLTQQHRTYSLDPLLVGKQESVRLFYPLTWTTILVGP